jgi:uncharacterized protein
MKTRRSKFVLCRMAGLVPAFLFLQRAWAMQRKFRIHRLCAPCIRGAALAALILSVEIAPAQQPALPTIKLNAGIYVIQAEVASTGTTRSQGLMRRRSMAQGAGMLFLFDESAGHCMWMKDTLIPLSVAFIDEGGKIVNIADMLPLDETTHCATRPVRYALEMNEGWFAKRGIGAGMQINGIPQTKRAR